MYICDNVYVAINNKEFNSMELGRNRKGFMRELWISFDKTKAYQNYMLKNGKNKSRREAMNMEVKIHNQLGINYDKTLTTVSYIANATLGKFSKKNRWRLEVWLDEKASKSNPLINCGVALIRPKKETIYAKKHAGNLKVAIKQSIGVIEKSIRREGERWDYESTSNYASQ
jgi:hypothetical protein